MMVGRSGRVVLQTCVALGALLIVACSPGKSPAAGNQEAAIVSNANDEALLSAEAEAQKTLPVFWSKFDARAPEYGDFQLKVGLPTDDGRGEEFVWMTVNEVTADQQIHGRISDEPTAMRKLHRGSAVAVDPSLIADWTYTKNGKAYGHFTTRALMKSANPEQRAQAEALLAPTPLEVAN